MFSLSRVPYVRPLNSILDRKIPRRHRILRQTSFETVQYKDQQSRFCHQCHVFSPQYENAEHV